MFKNRFPLTRRQSPRIRRQPEPMPRIRWYA
jgi:hypothetical protein